MSKLRKFCAYRNMKRAYTRKSKFRAKSFIRASPVTRIVRFDMGNLVKTDWPVKMHLVCRLDLNIRDNALESARQVANKLMEGQVGVDNFHLRIRVFPHHMMRENPIAAGAGADRISTGMSQSFGKVIGLAARVYKNTPIFEISTTPQFADKAKEALTKASKKMPASYSIIVTRNALKAAAVAAQ